MSTSILLICVGLFAIIATIIKPNFYWNSRKARRFRKFFGDTVTTIIYLAIGSFAIILGITELL